MTWKIVKEKLVLILICLGLLFLSVVPHISTEESIVFGLGLLSIVVCIICAVKLELFTLKDLQVDWKRGGWILLVFLLLQLFNHFDDVMQALEGIKGTQNQQIVGDEVAHYSPFLLLFDVALVAPLAEEVIFRGIIPRLLFKKHPRLGYVVGAILFGLLHSVSSVSEAIIYIGGGLVFALASYRYGRLSDSLIIHIINNAL